VVKLLLDSSWGDSSQCCVQGDRKLELTYKLPLALFKRIRQVNGIWKAALSVKSAKQMKASVCWL
jgi:hypothetical protein